MVAFMYGSSTLFKLDGFGKSLGLLTIIISLDP